MLKRVLSVARGLHWSLVPLPAPSFRSMQQEVFMANDVDPEGAEVEPIKRSRKPLLIVVVVLVLAGLGGGYFWMSRSASHAKDPKAAVAGEVKPEIYLPLEPAFVVTFREGDGDALRYLQVGVTLMSHDAAAIGVAKEADPVVRDSLVALFSSQKFEIVSEAAGRQKLQADALIAVRKIVEKRLGRPGIDALYFTSFVIQ
ncbi:flagellar basal body-associated FliL family protein [Rhodanobacter sp. AS-Z3]|uniref:flagellar basal body-associated FliL family protein n=1 Tax=Rhodanobacter sp. AS-Z3 TaxID=3031330 RepID=UPI0024787AF8|nr:flagellar basal body-associated FliL family protein [Rhodanobacter sp. AS-Z3]WEN14605.1 flagellar basal body-associated FliL family protein [Rhodanobacter sp. AS-Z3]